MSESQSFLNPVAARRAAVSALIFCAAVFLFLATAASSRAQSNILEFPIYSSSSSIPAAITYGADGAFWFTEYSGGRLGRIFPSSQTNNLATTNIAEVLLTNAAALPFGITQGPNNDTNLWFTEYLGCKIGRISVFATNTYSEYPLPNTNAGPHHIIVGPDGNLWFIEFNLNRIAAIAPTVPPATNADGTLKLLYETGGIHTNGQVIGSSPFTGTTQLSGLAVGADNNIWFTEGTPGFIGRVSLNNLTNYSTISSNAISEFQLPFTNSTPVSITAGPDGAMWFTELNSNNVGRITLDGQHITEYPVPLISGYPNPGLYQIIKGPDKDLWFTEYFGSALGSISTAGIITMFPTPTTTSYPSFLTAGTGPDTNIWFTEDVDGAPGITYSQIGRIDVSQALHLSGPLNPVFNTGKIYTNFNAVFQNSNGTNTVTINWDDGTLTSLIITNTFAVTNTTNTFLSITQTVPMDTNANNATYQISAAHTYAFPTNIYTNGSYLIKLTVTDPSNDFSTANISLLVGPAFQPTFFSGSRAAGNDYAFLQFPDSIPFGYFSILYYPYVFHADMGFQFFVDGADANSEAYLYDFKAGHWFFTSASLFPYIYDFTLESWLYYFPDTSRPGHYLTNPRVFYDFGNDTFIKQ